MTTDQKTQKDLPEWWDTFCNAVKTRTMNKYECRASHWAEESPWRSMVDMVGALYLEPHGWQFRKAARTVNINGVDLVAPVLAGDVMPQDTSVFSLAVGAFGRASLFDAGAMVFTSSTDRDAIRAALMGVKP